MRGLLAPKDKYRILAEFRTNRKNRGLKEVQKLLEAFDFQYRPSKKEQGGVWRRGQFTLTLPQPHGGEKSLKPFYVSLVVQIIEAAEAADAKKEDPH